EDRGQEAKDEKGLFHLVCMSR
ncbi:MAG: hypothetical protein JWP27_810, partial [Flaviaesturariibacter sp.]|nr:hypothetical protein [Flaviaesturariibacter sp.]